MRTIATLCIIALIACAAAAPKNQHAKVDTRTVFAEMETSKFGSTVLNFLSLNAKEDLPVAEVQTTIADVLDQLQNRQADADANNNTNQALCDDVITRLTNQIANEEFTIDSLKNAIVSNDEILEQAKRDLELAASDYDETVSALDGGNAQREAEHARWVDIDYEHTEAITAVEESIKLIKHMIHGVTFAQIKPRFEKVQETLKKSNKFSTLFKPLILGLSELATKLNYENVVKILDLLGNINGALSQSQTEYANTENTQASDWAALENHLSNQKASLADKKSRLNALITSTVGILEQSRSSLEFHSNQLVKAQTNLGDQENWCITVSEIYVDETRERSRETEILETITEHLQERWGSVAEYLQTRAVAF